MKAIQMILLTAVMLLTMALPAGAVQNSTLLNPSDQYEKLHPYPVIQDDKTLYGFCDDSGNQVTDPVFVSWAIITSDNRTYFLARDIGYGQTVFSQSGLMVSDRYANISQVGPYFLCRKEEHGTKFDILDQELNILYTEQHFTKKNDAGEDMIFVPADYQNQKWICQNGDDHFLFDEIYGDMQLAMPGVHDIKITSCGELVLRDRLGYTTVFDSNGKRITVDGQSVFLYYDRSIGGQLIDVRMTDGLWKQLDKNRKVLCDNICEAWTDSDGIVAVLSEEKDGFRYQYYDLQDNLIAERVSDTQKHLTYSGVGNIYFEVQDNRTRLWDAVTEEEVFLPFPVGCFSFDGRVGLQTGRAALNSNNPNEIQCVLVDADMNVQFIPKRIYMMEDKVTGENYIFEYGEKNALSALYDAKLEQKLLTAEGYFTVCDGMISVCSQNSSRLYCMDGSLFFEYDFS